MNYLIAGLAKSGTTILFSRLREALPDPVLTYFEPDQDQQLADILAAGAVDTTLTKVLIGRVTADNALLRDFERHVLIYRDPRDQFISMLLYLFYDFQLSGDSGGFRQARDALQDKVNDPERYSTIELYNTVAGLVGRAPIGVFNNLHREQQAYIERFSPHLLRYEDFIDGKLGGVEGYLSLSLKNKAEVADSYTRVARSRAYGDWKTGSTRRTRTIFRVNGARPCKDSDTRWSHNWRTGRAYLGQPLWIMLISLIRLLARAEFIKAPVECHNRVMMSGWLTVATADTPAKNPVIKAQSADVQPWPAVAQLQQQPVSHNRAKVDRNFTQQLPAILADAQGNPGSGINSRLQPDGTDLITHSHRQGQALEAHATLQSRNSRREKLPEYPTLANANSTATQQPRFPLNDLPATHTHQKTGIE